MANSVRVKLNTAGVGELLNSSGMQSVLLGHAQRVASRAGEGFTADVQAGKTRAHARVNASTWEAVGRNRRDNTLLKALGGG